MVTKLRIERSWWKMFDPAAVIAMEAAWEWFQTHSSGSLKKGCFF